MNLVQKLPIGLGLACLLMMSSCSKEDNQAPEPRTENVNTNSNLHEASSGLVVTLLPYFAPTYGRTGFNVYPPDWERDPNASNDLNGLPTGISSSKYLFGNPAIPWEKPLPGVPSAASHKDYMLTFTSHTDFNPIQFQQQASKRSGVATKIKNLKLGKTYSIMLYAASTITKVPQNAYPQSYAEFIVVTMSQKNSTGHYVINNLDPAGAIWAPKEIIFTAEDTEIALSFHAFAKSDNEFTYGHIFVDKNSIKQIN